MKIAVLVENSKINERETQSLRAEGIRYVMTGHCTGQVGYAKLQERIPERLVGLTTGLVVEL